MRAKGFAMQPDADGIPKIGTCMVCQSLSPAEGEIALSSSAVHAGHKQPLPIQ